MQVRYLLSRLAQAVFTIYVVTTLSFVMIRFIPGGPMDYVRAQMAQRMTQSGGSMNTQVIRRVEELTNINPDAPLHVQYVNYLSSLARGDFGQSIWFDQSVSSIIGDALPWTVFLMVTASAFMFAVAIVIGGVMAYYEGTKFDNVMTIIETLSGTVPYYVFAIFLLELFAYSWGIFPQRGRMASGTTPGLNLAFFVGVASHAFLPFLSLVLAGFGSPALQMRGNSINILGSDYLRVGRLRGLKERTLATQYVVRNGVLPLYTGFLISLASMFGGSVILERIFKYPGMGYYLVEAFRARDYPLMMAGFIILTTATIIGVFVADVTYGMIDPRIKTGNNNESF